MLPTRKSAILAAFLAAATWPAEAGQNSEHTTTEAPSPASCAAPEAVKAAGEDAPAPPPVLVEGLGYAGIAPDTASPDAKAWFEQGVRLVWAYDEQEAVRSFEQAQKADPGCPMCFWGEAWARSPTLNLQPRDEMQPKAAAAIAKAAALSGKLGPKEQGLIQAVQLRVAGKGATFDNKAYRKAMAKLASRYPQDDAILVLAADSRLIQRDLKPGDAAQTWLETVLARNANHSGAIHLYIHLTDIIERQALAERFADRLGRLAPGASHLVHMPSHTFYGVGRYKDAASVNVAALAADDSYVERVKPPPSDYRTGLYAHNSHFAIESALIRGDGPTALRTANHFRERHPESERGGFAVLRASTWYAYGLHADPTAVLAMAEPAAKASLMRGMRHYARGEALARKGDASAVRAEAAAIAKLLAGPEGRALGSKPVEALVGMAQRVLEGRAAMLEGNHAAAASAYRAGMQLQDKAGFGTDPPPFWYSVRRSLGAALLAAGELTSARAQLQASLKHWPNDPLALYALSQAERKLGRQAEAEAALARAKASWAGDLAAMPLTRI